MSVLRGPVLLFAGLISRFVGRPFWVVGLWLLRRCTEEVQGVSVLGCDERRDADVEKLRKAFAVLEKECPTALRRMPTDVRVITASSKDYERYVYYHHSMRAIQLSRRTVHEKGAATLAAVLLIGCTEARLRGSVAGYSYFLNDRIAEIAVRRAWRLATRLGVPHEGRVAPRDSGSRRRKG